MTVPVPATVHCSVHKQILIEFFSKVAKCRGGPIKMSLGGGDDNECTVTKVELTDGRSEVEMYPFASTMNLHWLSLHHQ